MTRSNSWLNSKFTAPSACAAPPKGCSAQFETADRPPARRDLGHRGRCWSSASRRGETADVLILSRAGIDALKQARQGRAGLAMSTLASSGVAIAVKAGAPKPDISTPEALKQTLLAAKSIAYSEPSAGGASGVYFAKLIERMGIAEADEAEDQISAAGRFSGELLLTGEAELAVQQKTGTDACRGHRDRRHAARRSEPGHGIRRGHHAGQRNIPMRRKHLIEMLRTPQAKAAFRAKGLDPKE